MKNEKRDSLYSAGDKLMCKLDAYRIQSYYRTLVMYDMWGNVTLHQLL